MNRTFVLFGLCFFTILGCAHHSYDFMNTNAKSQAAGETLVLYDAASGTVPGTPPMSFTDFPPGAARPVYSDGTTVLDTAVSGPDTYAGWSSSEPTTPGFPALDQAAGFQVVFTLQIENESHSKNDRSGFSLILLSEDARGIELAFWENEIWAQSDASTGGLFQHGEGTVFPTISGMVEYRLTVTGDTYALAANGQSILTGPVRDYSAFEGFPDPYQTPNFLFLGDNTTSAQARVRLRFVSITGTEPAMPTGTAVSTSLPPLTASPAPPPSPTPVPTPAPARRGFEFCLSGSLLLALVLASPRLRKYPKNIR